MGISHRTVSFLRDTEHDVQHLHDEGLDTLPDAQILAKAKAEERILLTHDLDFGELLAISRANFPSIVTFRLRDMRPENVNRHLEEIIAAHAHSLLQGVAMTVTENRLRIHPLPI